MEQSFRSFARHRRNRDEIMPEADKIVPLVAQAGHRGITRYEIGGVIDLERDALDQLLGSLTSFGMLTASHENGVVVYRSGTVA